MKLLHFVAGHSVTKAQMIVSQRVRRMFLQKLAMKANRGSSVLEIVVGRHIADRPFAWVAARPAGPQKQMSSSAIVILNDSELIVVIGLAIPTNRPISQLLFTTN